MTNELTAPVTGAHTTDGLPHGSTSITPHIVVSPAASAIDFYVSVFGARVLDTTRFPGSDLVAHADLDFGTGRLTLSDPLGSYGLHAANREHTTYSLALYVTDVDGVLEASVTAGAHVREPAMTFVSGDRFASIVDPVGVRWSIMTRVEDLSPEESRRRVEEWSATQSG
jgi:uncharacterized glyoxalase superfamily protein PhnB